MAYGIREGVKIIIYDRTTTSGTNRRNERTSRASVRSGRTLPYIDNNGGGNLQPKIMEENGFYEKMIKDSEGETSGVYLEQTSTFWYRKQLKGLSRALKAEQHDCGVVDKCRIRKLTPRETWRLMGFSDEEFDRAKAVNSDSQLYKQAGNSIVVSVLEEIFRRML